MGAKVKAIFVVLILSLVFLDSSLPILAADNCTLNANTPKNGGYFINPEDVLISSSDVRDQNNAPASDSSGNSSQDYFLHIFVPGGTVNNQYVPITSSQLQNGVLQNVNITSVISGMFTQTGDTVANFTVQLEREAGINDTLICSKTIQFQKPPAYNCGTPQIALSRNGDLINLNITVPGGPLNLNQTYAAYVRVPGSVQLSKVPLQFNGNILTGGVMERWPDGNYALEVGHGGSNLDHTLYDHTNCTANFTVVKNNLPDDDNPGDNFPAPDPGGDKTVAFQLCAQAGPDTALCTACVAGGNVNDPNANQKFWTAFGCISVSKEGIVTSLIRVGLGISGGFVLLTILYGAFLLTTSSGDPKRVQEGQEMVTSAIMGLVFVIFSIIILRFIGVTILQIPGFGA